MKAISYTEFGSPDVLKVTEVDRPAPGNRDVQIRVVATTVTSAECAMRRGEPRWGRVILGFTAPKPLVLTSRDFTPVIVSSDSPDSDSAPTPSTP